ncbi:MAG TPA: RluA family pseudouridine synthase [Candidatus Eisenbacteria bacterium]|jgi:23S rRNA pseudouridine1911/1915/1917 synthase|nr:RluA family pseudouridine synthase [Candidatus Eisenbacteria bacterium]
MEIIKLKKDGGLLEALVASGLPRTRAKSLLKHGAVKLNGRAVTKHDEPAAAGDRVEILRGAGLPPTLRNARGGVSASPRIVFEDAHVLVVEKPAGLLSVATEKEKERTIYFWLNEYLRPKRQRVFIVHRLDREASGLMVFAKDEPSKRALQKGWEGTEKRYWALVEGLPDELEGELEGALRENTAKRVYVAARGGKPAITRYRVVHRVGRHSLLEIELLTGRKHQIRVHLSTAGHPIAGDEKYGAVSDPAGRLALHAYFLSFAHPVTGERMRFETPPPPFAKKL